MRKIHRAANKYRLNSMTCSLGLRIDVTKAAYFKQYLINQLFTVTAKKKMLHVDGQTQCSPETAAWF
jgi:hypothetical protein